MNLIKLACAAAICLTLFSVAATCQQPAAAGAQTGAPAKQELSEKYVVYYFMTTTRCPSCHKIETYTHSTVLDKFAEELASGKVEWRMINTDEEANEHYIKDYGLFTKTVIVSRVVDGKEVSWKNLDKVWQLIGNQDKFQKYIESEIRAFMKEKK